LNAKDIANKTVALITNDILSVEAAPNTALKFEDVLVGHAFNYDDVWFSLDDYKRSISIPGLGMSTI
jgi:hypothetical protein